MRLPLYKYVLVVIDYIILNLSFAIALRVRFSPEIDIVNLNQVFVSEEVIIYAILSLFVLLIFENNQLYRYQIFTTRWHQAFKLIKALTVNVLLTLFMCSFLFHFGGRFESRLFLFYFWIILIILFILYRSVFYRSLFLKLQKKGIFKRRLIIYGAGKRGALVKEKIDIGNRWQFVGFIDDHKVRCKENRIHGGFDELKRISDNCNIDTVVIAIDRIAHKRLQELINALMLLDVRIYVVSEKYEILNNTQILEEIDGVPLVEVNYNSRNWYLNFSKRVIDIVLTSIGLIIISPFLLLIAAIIKSTSKGPIVFKQIRIGKDGKPFEFYKFRSMYINNKSAEHEQFVKDFISGNVGSETKKIQHDPRITPIGRFIRKTSIDEFPQLFNVLKGQMSLVGPRPCLPYEYEQYKDWHKTRFMIRPGCTGVWQVSGRSKVTFEEMVIMDYYYIHNTSPWLDLKLIIRTVPVVLFGKGGY